MRRSNDRVLAAVEVGTNAVRLRLVRQRAAGTFDTLCSERDPIRPGEGSFVTGVIPERVIERLERTLRRYADLCRLYDAEVRAVATSALRDARNRDEVLARLRLATGLPFEVISGHEEARLACLGVLHGTPAHVRSICIDLGGGSTEVAHAEGEQPRQLSSLQLGTVRLTEHFGARFGARETWDAPQLAALRAHAAEVARELPLPAPAIASDEGPQPRVGLGCSGTIRALVEHITGGERPEATLPELSRTVELLARMDASARRRAFEARRADIVVAGAVILEAVAERLSLEAVRGTRRGLRDGILVDLQRSTLPYASQACAATGAAASSRGR